MKDHSITLPPTMGKSRTKSGKVPVLQHTLGLTTRKDLISAILNDAKVLTEAVVGNVRKFALGVHLFLLRYAPHSDTQL